MIRTAHHEGTDFTIWVPEQQIHQIFINDKEQSDLPIGWAMLLSTDLKQCMILYIQIRPRFRRMGYAKKLIGLLQHVYDCLITDYEPALLDEPSTELLTGCGFKIVPSLHKNVPGKIEWRKPCAPSSNEKS